MAICLRCGRPLKNKQSAQRGYGPSCYKKVTKAQGKESDLIIDEVDRVEIDGQVNFVDELKEHSNKNEGEK